jgi:hypothetical protein
VKVSYLLPTLNAATLCQPAWSVIRE